MKLPNYFLADLPPEATLSPSLLSDACVTLKHNRETYLLRCSTEQIVQVLAEVAAGWLESENPFRQLALEHGPAQLGFSRATLERGMDGFFRQLTVENFHALLGQEFGDARILEIVTEHREGSASAILDRLMKAVRDFTRGGRQRDDMSVLVVRYLA